ncbi:polysaccharide pyruvyl transferase family protein [Lacrimispora sp.]|uniref:polysaccharide pyruvyl transferase family protein n=1 Tax=Lacrimispora sp. TaxID=2719234 RepID=UPI00285D6683|nr:polysaccharide pyruvyl transferase family protein [Lacrimispora sp.]MDR7813051.1 polysaccharide pyruvyl transferase family protein [Lacrimispora sp.]
MKKVGIVSCYFQHNYGSMLQAYATQMALDKMEIENETINISGFNREIKKEKIKYFIKASLTSDILLSKFGMAKNALIRRISKSDYAAKSKIRDIEFDAFSKKEIRLSERYSTKFELSQKCKANYTAILVGSDQLWLPGNIAADYYTLNFVPNEVNSIAYATSFGQSVLTKDSSKKAAVFLRRIKHIGIREESGQKLVDQLCGRKVPIVCDPTLLFTGEEWMEIQQEKAIIDEPYIFCYFLGNNPPHREFARRLKSETGYKIVALTHLDEYVKCENEYADMAPYDIDPADFLNLIRNASYVCTDSFHCSVFSILYRRTFFTFKRYTKKTKQSTNSRLDTLFNLTGISGRIKNGDEDITECLIQSIDFDRAHERLMRVREESYGYLKKALADEGSTDID